MGKKLTAVVKLQIKAGAANPSPPIGPALGQHGANIMEFCKAFNAMTQQLIAEGKLDNGMLTPVEISIYSDRSFTFILKSPPASVLLAKAIGRGGSSKPNTEKVGKVTVNQLEKIVQIKQADLTAADMAAAVRTIAGTARSMGIEVVEE